MSPQERSILKKIVHFAGDREWSIRIRAADVEMIVTQRHLPTTTTTLWSLGLSPRGRGNPLSIVLSDNQAGSIPAWAGKPARVSPGA